ncbi:MAG: indolepyruvate ferredoxin oxidoreductase subunit alpha [Candidatus Eisenbacteria bacterium]|nr:indolepyruvate ferredoxin oxidoreductase subunit alpha [Candidatus Eisenbacteria bacterium]
MEKQLLSGDEAIARGAWEAGCHVAAAYPGTPSTEILENLATYEEVYCEWSTNEKVALEVALGASICGARALATMKHVGLNVAADPFFSAAYIGAYGGLVIVSADDPGMHSSQNEQDNRYYGMAAKVPVLSPSDSQEALDFTKQGFDLSEQFDIPVLLRITTRIAHSNTVVAVGPREAREVKGYDRQSTKTILLPAFARRRHVDLEGRIDRLREYTEQTPLNRIEQGSAKLGIVCDGVAYQYAREVFPDASFLKLGMVHPFPAERVRRFAAQVSELIVIEEVDPFLEMQIRALGLQVTGKDRLPRWDELTPGVVQRALAGAVAASGGVASEAGTATATMELPAEPPTPEADLPMRPPALCAGCPHMGIFFALQKRKVIIGGDIGCYTLGALAPHEGMDTCIDMGASITFAHGADKALGEQDPRKRVAFIGDSTFFHSGMTGLVNVAYNQSDVLTIIADNRTTGMTGHQEHPGTGKTLKGAPTDCVDPEAIARACGIEQVATVDPYQVKETRKVVSELLAHDGPAVLITKRACALVSRIRETPKRVDPEICIYCKTCLRLGCPALTSREGKAFIVDTVCVGCGMCADVCPRGAIS